MSASASEEQNIHVIIQMSAIRTVQYNNIYILNSWTNNIDLQHKEKPIPIYITKSLLNHTKVER